MFLACLDVEFHVKLQTRKKADNFILSLVAVYGAVQEDFKAVFLRELVNLAKENPYPVLIGDISTCLYFLLRRAKVGSTIVDLSYAMQSLTSWI
jgi:hypothetical protein